MANKRMDQLTPLVVITGSEFLVFGDPATGELYKAPGNQLLAGIANKSETIPFTGVAEMDVAWDTTRIAKYGTTGKFYVEIVGPDGIPRYAPTTEIIPDSLITTTSYHFNFGGVETGRITVF